MISVSQRIPEIAKVVLDPGLMYLRPRTRYRFGVLEIHKKYLYYCKKVSFAHAIPKSWLSEPDTEPKNSLDPGSTEPSYRYSTTLVVNTKFECHSNGQFNLTIHSLLGVFQASTPSPGGAPSLPISYEAENFVSTATERDNYEENYSKERWIRDWKC